MITWYMLAIFWTAMSCLFWKGLSAAESTIPEEHHMPLIQKVLSCIVWPYTLWHYRRKVRETDRVLRLITIQWSEDRSEVTKQLVIRKLRPIRVAPEEWREGDRVYQFIHHMWKPGYTVVEGVVYKGQMSWATGHIEAGYPEDFITYFKGWARLPQSARAFLQSKQTTLPR